MPMISPDGAVGDVPQEHVPDAVKAGYKVGQDMLSPDGQAGTIPLERVHDAIKSGFQMKPPAAANAHVDMQPEGVVVPNAGRIPGQATGSNKVTDEQAEGGLAAGAAAGGGVLAAGPAAALTRSLMQSHPMIASVVLSEAISHARKIPGIGKLIPPYAELAPFMMGKGAKAAEAAPEAEAAEGEFSDSMKSAEQKAAGDMKSQAQSESETLDKMDQAGKKAAGSMKSQAAESPRTAPKAYRVLPKEEPNIGEGRTLSGESALNHYGSYLGEDDLAKLAEKRGIPKSEIGDLLSKGREVQGTGEGGRLTGEDISNNVKTEYRTQKLWNRIQDTYTPDELEKIGKRANTFFNSHAEAQNLGKGTKVLQKMVKERFFPELK